VTALAHHVLIGHPPIPDFIPQAHCCGGLGSCAWHADAEHDLDAQGRPAVRAAAVAHAGNQGHRVVFDDATSWTVIEAWRPCARLRASDGGVCGNDERPVCTEAHLGQVTS
jgi:hypothetical protein